MIPTVKYESIQECIFTLENYNKHHSEYTIVLQFPLISIRKDILEQIENPTSEYIEFNGTWSELPEYTIVDIREKPNFLAYPVRVDKSVTRPTLVRNGLTDDQP